MILKCAVLGKMKLSFFYQSANNEVFVEFLYPYQYLGAANLKKKLIKAQEILLFHLITFEIYIYMTLFSILSPNRAIVLSVLL